jgi:acyl-CoA reductase-like NAD-dependent aldehyde dehydrogenase
MSAESNAGTAGEEAKCWIGGEAVAGEHGTYEIRNPATENVIALAPQASAGDARRAAAAAREAFASWAATTPEQRSALLFKAADLLEAKQKELFDLVQQETGSTTFMTRTAQVPGAIARLRRYAKGALEPVTIPLAPATNWPGGPDGMGGGITTAMGARRPVGVVAAITSYNVPMNNVAGKIGPALAMGNTVVVKPAPQDPLGVIAMVEAMNEAGFPPGVVNLVVGATPESAEALVSSADVDMVSFTGSSAVGARIAETCSTAMRRTLLELGGKGASIVFAGADLERAAAGTASTFTFHAGQICTAPTRLIAQRSVYQELVERLAELARAATVGDPTDRATVVGPLISAQQRDRVEAYIAGAVAAGAELVAGGGRAGLERGFFIEPTVLAGCDPSMAAVQEEIFGPVVVAMPFDDPDEAIALANGTRYGLYDYLWTADANEGLRLAARLRSGNVGINTVGRNPETPFGGFKHSGVGRDGGSFALHAYTELQSVVWPG